MATFVDDSFTDANWVNLTAHTGAVGATWTNGTPAGSYQIYLNHAYPITAGVIYASGLPATAEYSVECDYKIVSATGSPGPAGRINTAANTYYGVYYDHSAGHWLLIRVVSGTITTLSQWVSGVTIGQTYRVKLELLNATKKVYVDGVERISSTDNTITAAGRAGLRSGSSNTSTTAKHMTNFLAYDGTTPGPPPHWFYATVS